MPDKKNTVKGPKSTNWLFWEAKQVGHKETVLLRRKGMVVFEIWIINRVRR